MKNEDNDKRLTRNEIWLTVLKWAGGLLVPSSVIFMTFVYSESQAGQSCMDTESKVKFATIDEQVSTLRRDIKSIDRKIDTRFDRLEKMINSLK